MKVVFKFGEDVCCNALEQWLDEGSVKREISTGHGEYFLEYIIVSLVGESRMQFCPFCGIPIHIWQSTLDEDEMAEEIKEHEESIEQWKEKNKG